MRGVWATRTHWSSHRLSTPDQIVTSQAIRTVVIDANSISSTLMRHGCHPYVTLTNFSPSVLIVEKSMFNLTSMLALTLLADPEPKIDIAELVDGARKATVQVSGESRRARRRSTRWGGGVIVGDRHAILTCLHVIDGYPNLVVETHDQREHGATIVATFPDRDLALLKMDSDKLYPGVTVKEGTWKAGQIAIAVGFPQLHGRSILVGKIRDIRRDVIYSNVSPETPLLAFRAETSFGFSGGPLLNIHGEFVGMIVARTDDEDSLAIPPAISSRPWASSSCRFPRKNCSRRKRVGRDGLAISPHHRSQRAITIQSLRASRPAAPARPPAKTSCLQISEARPAKPPTSDATSS